MNKMLEKAEKEIKAEGVREKARDAGREGKGGTDYGV